MSDSSHPGLRVVLDTNVLVSGLAYPSSVPGKIVSIFLAGGLYVVLSKHILEETQRVLPRVKCVKRSAAEIADIVDNVRLKALLVEPTAGWENELRDDNDQPVLGTLIASDAAYLITGDKDLLALAAKYPIMTPAEFWERHG